MFQLQQLKIFTTTSIIKFRRHQNKFKLGQLETWLPWFFSVCQPSLSGAHYCVSLQSDDNTTETHTRCRKCKAARMLRKHLKLLIQYNITTGWCCRVATQTSRSSTCQVSLLFFLLCFSCYINYLIFWYIKFGFHEIPRKNYWLWSSNASVENGLY